MRSRTILVMALAVVVTGWALGMGIAAAEDQKEEEHGALFVMTNSTDVVRGNEVVMYDRSPNGDLTLIGYFPTGDLATSEPQFGSGPAPTSKVLAQVFGPATPPVPATADGLGSSDSLILNREHRCLFAVNAGSDTVSSFRVRRDGLDLQSVVDSRGDLEPGFPVSLTEFRNILYVLNAGDEGSLTGFRVRHNCVLVPLAGSSRGLSGVTDSFPNPEPNEVLTTPSHISFTPHGKRLVLAVKGGDAVPASDSAPGVLPSGRMAVFPVGRGALLGAPVVTPFSTPENRGSPFSFIFANANTLIVTHANSNTVASYTIEPDNTLKLLSGPFDTGDFAPCWIAFNGHHVAVANVGLISFILGGAPDANGSLKVFRVTRRGTLVPLEGLTPFPDPGPGRSGNHAIDVRVVGDFLYAVQPRTGMVGRWTIRRNGELVDPVNFGGLSPGPEPFDGFNPGIFNFTERCFLQDPTDPSPECLQGSAQGIAGF